MPSARTSRAATNARNELLAQLKDDHKQVKKAYREFQKLDAEEDPEACEQLVLEVLDALTLHAALEEELLYPAVRGAVDDEMLIDEAEVEHEAAHQMIEQLRGMSPDDEKYAARFTVLCEYVLHHVKEEETELFPQLERARLDWEALCEEVNARRAELSGEQEETEGEEALADRGDAAAVGGSAGDADESDDETPGTGSAPDERRPRGRGDGDVEAAWLDEGGGSDDAEPGPSEPTSTVYRTRG